MSEFLKFSFELISAVVYNLVACAVGFFGGLGRLFITGWPEYVSVFRSYFGTLSLVGKVLAILLVIILIAIPVGIVILIVRRIILHIRLRETTEDNVTLFKEIGRLNKQVLQLMDEKNQILALKAGGVAAYGPAVAGTGSIDMDEAEEGAARPIGVPPIGGTAAGINLNGDGTNIVSGGGVAVGGAAVGAAGVAVGAGSGTGGTASGGITIAGIGSSGSVPDDSSRRFPKLALVDERYTDYERPDFDDEITLQQFVENYRLFASSQMHLYYTPEIIRRFVAGMASSKILILEGISGTGKTSLPYSFSRYLDNPATLVSVQPSFRDRTELLGYFNEFSKRFNETEFLRALYEAGYREDPCFIVLDEMNLARIEYYFAEMLSVLELPNQAEWTLDLVPTAWPGDPTRMDGGKISVSPNTWFVGTANNDDSTFTITDKVYDRAMPIELNERANAFECPEQPKCHVTYAHLLELFAKAKDEHPISESTMAKMVKMNEYLMTRFKLAFGNRIMKQMYDFIPVYVACGGTELDGLDYILARKVLKKFETQNVSFVRDEIKGLLAYMEKIFGKSHMADSVAYLQRIQNLY